MSFFTIPCLLLAFMIAASSKVAFGTTTEEPGKPQPTVTAPSVPIAPNDNVALPGFGGNGLQGFQPSCAPGNPSLRDLHTLPFY